MRKEKISHLSIVLPLYNEEVAVGRVLTETLEWLEASAEDYEVILVDDGSTDRTVEMIKKLKDEAGVIKLVSHEQNLGYGMALRSGFEKASKEWIFQMDADGQFKIEELMKLARWQNDYDVIVGYRERRADNFGRRLMTWGYNQVINRLFRLGLKDVGCAYKLFKRECWDKVKPIEAADHKVFLVELMLKIKQLGVSVKEVPVAHYPRLGGEATGMKWRAIKGIGKEIIRLKRYG